MKSSDLLSSKNGFTLIVVLIAITIMATLSLLAAQTIRQAIRQKKVIQEQVDETSRLRDAMKIFEKDINLAYHHRDWELEIQNLAKKKNKKPQTPAPNGQVPQFDANGNLLPDQSNVEAPRQDPTTKFIGHEQDISFVTMNTGRILKNLTQADFIEVGYILRDCQSLDGKTESKCLYRRSSPWVDNDVTKGGDEILLLENITEFSLQYMGKGKQDWVKDWRSDEGGDGATKGNFPWAVEVSITIQKKEQDNSKYEGKKYSMQLVIPLHFPNNKDDFSDGEPSKEGP